MAFIKCLVCLLLYIPINDACQSLNSPPTLIGGGGGITHPPPPPGCLHVNEKVLMADGTLKPASDLIIGDRIWNGDGQSTPVVMLPKLSNQIHQFIKFGTKNGYGTTVTLDHLVFAGRCGLIKNDDWPIKAARDLVEGECVPTVNGYEEIVSVEVVELAGKVLPITESGKLAVGGVVVSCYDHFGRPMRQYEKHAFYEPMRALYGWAEKIYFTISNEAYAFDIIESLIRCLGLDSLAKMYW